MDKLFTNKNFIKEAFEYLKSKGIVHTQQDVADIMSVPKSNISRAFNKDPKYLTENFITRFNQQFGNIFNETYLNTGEGSLLSEPKEEAVLIKNDILLTPLISQYAHAGYMAGFADDEYMETLPRIPWVVDMEHKGNYISFEVRGDSMDDGLKHSYEQGDILLCREINRDYWKSKLHLNQWDAFVIVHKTDGIVVKQIVDHDVEKGIITVHSFNPLYEDYQIDLRDVAQIFNVVKQQKNK